MDDRVVDSREVEYGAAIRRRRECAACNVRFTTFERIGETSVLVVKRSGSREAFDRDKIVSGIKSACKNRPVGDGELVRIVAGVEELARASGGEIRSEQLGMAVLNGLRELDEVAYLRFASVYKGFESADDFEREAGLLTKLTAPKNPTDSYDGRSHG